MRQQKDLPFIVAGSYLCVVFAIKLGYKIVQYKPTLDSVSKSVLTESQNEGHYVVPITKCLFDPKYGRRLSIHLSARP